MQCVSMKLPMALKNMSSSTRITSSSPSPMPKSRLNPQSSFPSAEAREALRTVYHGRIDDRYLQIGQERPSATQHDLERAIVDVLQHRSVQQPDGPAVGCGIIGQP